MTTLILKNGEKAIIDNSDEERVGQYKWNLHTTPSGKKYVISYFNNQYLLLHRFLTNAPKGKEVDHINGNTLDNRKKNLRLCLHAENMRNRPLRKDNKTGFKGVIKKRNKWQAQIKLNGKTTNLGTFTNIIDAANAYNFAAKNHYKKFAVLNVI